MLYFSLEIAHYFERFPYIEFSKLNNPGFRQKLRIFFKKFSYIEFSRLKNPDSIQRLRIFSRSFPISKPTQESSLPADS
jgi:hypothetical protein